MITQHITTSRLHRANIQNCHQQKKSDHRTLNIQENVNHSANDGQTDMF